VRVGSACVCISFNVRQAIRAQRYRPRRIGANSGGFECTNFWWLFWNGEIDLGIGGRKGGVTLPGRTGTSGLVSQSRNTGATGEMHKPLSGRELAVRSGRPGAEDDRESTPTRQRSVVTTRIAPIFQSVSVFASASSCSWRSAGSFSSLAFRSATFR
jgi:hypothetical protein